MRALLYGLRAFRHRNVRLLLLAQFSSNLGYSAFVVAQSWLALDLTDSPSSVALITSATLAPLLFFALPAGVMADRVNRRRLQLGSRGLATSALLAEAALVAAGAIEPWQMVALGFVVGASVCLDNPPQYKLLAESGPVEDIPSATALSSVVLQLSSIGGPLAGGFALQAFGPAAAILVAATGNMVLLASYVAIGIPTARGAGGESALRGIARGFGFVFTHANVALAVASWAAGVAIVFPAQALLSVFARDEIATDGFGLGLLLTMSGSGALVGATLGGYDRLLRPSVATMALALALVGGALAALGFAPDLGRSLVLLGVLGFGWGIVTVMAFTVTLTHTPPELRGRGMGMMIWVVGFSPVGSAAFGFVAEATNSRTAYALGGYVAMGLAAVVLGLWLGLGALASRAGRTAPLPGSSGGA